MKVTTFNKLRKYEQYLYTAEYASYIRSMTNSQVEDLIGIAAELEIHYKHNHCPKCLLNFVQKLSKPYFAQKTKMENNRKNKTDKNDE